MTEPIMVGAQDASPLEGSSVTLIKVLSLLILVIAIPKHTTGHFCLYILCPYWFVIVFAFALDFFKC